VSTSVVKWSEVKCSWVKCSKGLSNNVSNIIIIYNLYIDHTKFATYMAFSFITFFHIYWFLVLSLYIWFIFCRLSLFL